MTADQDLPPGWAAVPLSQAVQPRNEKVSPSDYPEARFIGMNHVESHSTVIIGSRPASAMKSNAAGFRSGDVLYGRLRPYLNKVAQPNFDGLASAEFIVFPDRALIRSHFLKHRLNAADFVSFASHLNEGDRPRVSFDQIGEFEILLPPPSEQRRIVAKIEELFSELDKGVESLRTAKSTLDLYRKSLLKMAFEGRLTADWRARNPDKLESPDVLLARIREEREARHETALHEWERAVSEWEIGRKNGRRPAKPKRPLQPEQCEVQKLGPIPDGWTYLRFGALAWSIRNGISAKPDEVGPLKIFRISAVRPMDFDLNDCRRITDSDGSMERYRLKYGDLVFTRYSGSRDYVGVSAMYRGDGTHVYPDKLIRCEIDSDLVDAAYLEAATNCGESRAHLEARMRTTAGQSGVSGNDIKAAPVPICSPAEQAEIVRILDARLEAAKMLAAEIDARLARAEALRQSILKKAFSGQLVEQDPNDEPASVLLERIKAEKLAQSHSVKRQRAKVAA